MKNNFKICTVYGCNDLKVGYDYDSIMHYSERGWYGGKAIVPKTAGVTIGQRNQLSLKDVEGINEHYGCTKSGKLHVNIYIYLFIYIYINRYELTIYF